MEPFISAIVCDGAYINREQFDAGSHMLHGETTRMSLLLLGTMLVLCVLPSLLFLGLWRWLCRMQHQSLVTRSSARAGCPDPAVTWGDVIDAHADPQKRLLGPSPGSQSATIPVDQCATCATVNDPCASFCSNCLQKLE